MSSSVIPPTPSTQDYSAEIAPELAADVPLYEQSDPVALIKSWLVEAQAQEINDANAMALATVDASGLPDVRMVLLKDVDERGLVFYTNANSAKGRQLSQNGKAALCFHWKSLRRQIRVRGPVTSVDAAESDRYFEGRARGAQIGAWASAQSDIIAPEDSLERRMADIEARFDGQDVPRPENWYGWRVAPLQIEFWVSQRYRLHDRLVFSRAGTGESWAKTQLFP